MSTQNAIVMKDDTIKWEKNHYFSLRSQNNNTLNKKPGSM